MPGRASASSEGPQLKFYQRLVLNRYLLEQFGVSDLKELSAGMKKPGLEEVDNENVTGFHKHLLAEFGGRGTISQDRLAQYDWNILSHTRRINAKRDEPLVLKYFQYLALLFIEYYLDEYFGNRQGLLDGLNRLVEDFNAQYPGDAVEAYAKGDLNKIAVWNATGSGKTLVMHINYLQYLHYSGGKLAEDASCILLTPKEGLSLQHIGEFEESGIPAGIYDKSVSRWLRNKLEISVLENTKLGKRDQDAVVSVKRFGSRNVVFVDEGHRGSSSGRDGKWQKFRDELCGDGFSFEYSATFGQAIAASNDRTLVQRYAKCIVFDYSYKYFYGDGFGKDYNIINLPDDDDKIKRGLYLAACLLSYYQQKKLFLSNKSDFFPFNLENPLFVFVGASVNAVRTERGRKISDVVDILLFFNQFISESAASISGIGRIMRGGAGLLDSKDRDIFRNSFPYLTELNLTDAELYADILKTVFNCPSPGAAIHIENLRGVDGEIRLRLGENPPFGVIYVGDDSALLSLCAENGFHTDTIDFSQSLFYGITKADSTINLLIGSKKFTEGWNCWRVSTMGLMNVGRSEGSEIIQLFGRGVRLKGYHMSLKRSGSYKKDFPGISIPRHMELLETLHIFGIRADYMQQFREFLEREGLPSEKGQPVVLRLPVIRGEAYKDKGLYSLRVKGGATYKKHAAKPFLRFSGDMLITLDCYAKVQFTSSRERKIGEITKNPAVLRPENLAYLDYDRIYFELLRYKEQKGRFNVNITRQDVCDLLHNPAWYELLISEDELVVRDFEDYRRFEKIAVALLTKYFDSFYYAERSRWESQTVGYELAPLNDKNDNFLNAEKDEYVISISNPDENEALITWLQRTIEEVKKAKETGEPLRITAPRHGDLALLDLPAHLYGPLVYLAKNNTDISLSPVALVESESRFIRDLSEYLAANAGLHADRELYILRNRSKKGIGFFGDKGFYPDFIMWLIANGKQYITFIDPHGLGRESIQSDKVQLYARLKTDVQSTLTGKKAVLDSFVLSPTKYAELPDKSAAVAEWNANHVLFMDDDRYVEKLINTVLGNT